MTASDLARQIIRFKIARPHACKWSGDEIRRQAEEWVKHMSWLTPENLETVFTFIIGGGRLNMQDVVNRAKVIQPYVGPRGIVAQADLGVTPEERRQNLIMLDMLNIWSAWRWGNREPVATFLPKIRELFAREGMPSRSLAVVEGWFRNQNTPVEAPEIDGPIQNTGEGPETPPGAAESLLAANSGVLAGGGMGADEDIPF